MANTLVLGLGNPFRGDDGAGPAVISMLREKALPPGVDVIDGGLPGLETLLFWRGYQRVLIVDAADMGLGQGQWRRFTLGEAELPMNSDNFTGTMHSVGLAESLELAKALEMLPSELIFYGVQPRAIGWESNLSAEVRSAVTDICEAILLELINSWKQLLPPDLYVQDAVVNIAPT